LAQCGLWILLRIGCGSTHVANVVVFGPRRGLESIIVACIVAGYLNGCCGAGGSAQSVPRQSRVDGGLLAYLLTDAAVRGEQT